MFARRDNRQTAISVGRAGTEPTILAYLRDAEPGVLCFYAPCSHDSAVILCNYDDVAVGSYCAGHGRLALRQYGKALEARLADDGVHVA